MVLEEVAIVAFSIVSCFGIVALAYFKSEERKEMLRQKGITDRAVMKLGTGGDYSAASPTGEWWVPLATELLKNPQVQNMIMSKVVPALQTKVEG